MIALSNRSSHALASAASLMNVEELPARTASSEYMLADAPSLKRAPEHLQLHCSARLNRDRSGQPQDGCQQPVAYRLDRVR